LSARRGYYWSAGDTFDGPYQTVKEAKADASQRAPSIDITIHTLVAVEKTDKHGNWETVH
jgi:hypothetical protein